MHRRNHSAGSAVDSMAEVSTAYSLASNVRSLMDSPTSSSSSGNYSSNDDEDDDLKLNFTSFQNDVYDHQHGESNSTNDPSDHSFRGNAPLHRQLQSQTIDDAGRRKSQKENKEPQAKANDEYLNGEHNSHKNDEPIRLSRSSDGFGHSYIDDGPPSPIVLGSSHITYTPDFTEKYDHKIVLSGATASTAPSTYSPVTHLAGPPNTNSEKYRDNAFKSILSTVQQLPRPRLIPFSPMDVKGSKESKRDQNIITAASFAKNAPKAGYLSKLGTSVSAYKKRFFVLKPTTCLYYFLSPTDEEPRGCIDLDSDVLDGLKVNSLGCLPDGRFRFEIVIPVKGDKEEQSSVSRIRLEARNEDVGREWMEALEVERLSHSKKIIQQLNEDNQVLKKRVDELRLAEIDRDGAIEDANALRERVEKMNEAMLKLKCWILKAVDDDSELDKPPNLDEYSSDKNLDISTEDLEIDELNVPGTNFNVLLNACRGLRQNMKHTFVENASTLEDLKDANEKIKSYEERMAKAEKYICDLWEENCAIKEASKRKKNEKKVLVNEVRSLMEKSKQWKDRIESLEKENEELRSKCRAVVYGGTTDDESDDDLTDANEELDRLAPKITQLSTPGKKLLAELEQHIDNSLSLHRDLLQDSDDSIECENEECSPNSQKVTKMSVQAPNTIKTSNKRLPVDYKRESQHKLYDARDGNSSEENGEEDVDISPICSPKRSFSPLRPKQLSLIDQIVLQEEEEEVKRFFNKSSHISNTDEDSSFYEDSNGSLKSITSKTSDATMKLECPLTDVSRQNGAKPSNYSIYSITFYSQKIGIQFQKVPNNSNPRGSLTEAVAADLTESEKNDRITAQNRTEAELRLIASIRKPMRHSNGPNNHVDECCPVIIPKHSVLVCGINGFDDSSNKRPDIGARLVGFDGISIEKGPWTFESVKAAIKARGRPLTLTFRNDYLNLEQRTILTKAVSQSNAPLLDSMRPNHGMNVPVIVRGNRFNDRMDHSISFSDLSTLRNDDDASISNCSRSSDNWKSFSDTGSSNAFSSKLAPMVSGIISSMRKNDRLSTKKSYRDRSYGDSPLTPEYFRRSSDSLHTSPSHRKFTESLL